jgi:hypothetical protein
MRPHRPDCRNVRDLEAYLHADGIAEDRFAAVRARLAG